MTLYKILSINQSTRRIRTQSGFQIRNTLKFNGISCPWMHLW